MHLPHSYILKKDPSPLCGHCQCKIFIAIMVQNYCFVSGKIYLEFEATVYKTAGYIHCTVYYGAHRHEAQTIDIYGPQQKDPVATLRQSETDCTGIYHYHDFRNWCGPGSGVIGESVMYITIKSGLGPRDVGLYYCVLRKSGLKSPKVLLLMAGE